MNCCHGKGVQKCVLCWEVVFFSKGPLSEVPLYTEVLLLQKWTLQAMTSIQEHVLYLGVPLDVDMLIYGCVCRW